MAIELGRGESSDVGDIVGVSEGLAGKRFTAEDPPPALDEVEPSGAYRNEGLLNAGMRGEPVANGATAVAGEVVRDKVQISVRKGVRQRLERREVASGVARRGGLREDLPIAHTERAIDPDLVQSPLVVQWRFDAVSVC